MRGLIEPVIVHPQDEGFEIELVGEIAPMVEVALGADAGAGKAASNDKAASGRPLLDECSRRSVKVFAGT